MRWISDLGRLIIGFGCALGLGACTAHYPPLVDVLDGAGVTCLVGGRVLVGEALVPTEGATLCFADGVITRITLDPAAALPADAERIDVRGRTVMPGLVDTHVHVTATDAPPWHFRPPDPAHNLEAWLHAGITTVYDMGGVTEDVAALAREVEAGAVPGPQIFYGNEPITAPGGHPIPAIEALLPWPLDRFLAGRVPTLERSEDAPGLVDDVTRGGAGHLKIIHDALPPGAARLDSARLKALIEAAHARGLKAIVHIGSNRDALEAIEAGADHLAHGVYKEPISDEVVEALVERGVTVTYTAAGFANTRAMTEGRYVPAADIAATSDPGIVAAVSGEAGRAFAEQAVLGDFARTIVDEETLRANVAKLHAAGVVVLPGTDSPIAAVFPGGSYLEELELLQEAGIQAHVLVHRATVDAAALKAGEGGVPFGVLAEGARADVLVLTADPLSDVLALRRLERVFAAGRPVLAR